MEISLSSELTWLLVGSEKISFAFFFFYWFHIGWLCQPVHHRSQCVKNMNVKEKTLLRSRHGLMESVNLCKLSRYEFKN
jgi:hypothetical protein